MALRKAKALSSRPKARSPYDGIGRVRVAQTAKHTSFPYVLDTGKSVFPEIGQGIPLQRARGLESRHYRFRLPHCYAMALPDVPLSENLSICQKPRR